MRMSSPARSWCRPRAPATDDAGLSARWSDLQDEPERAGAHVLARVVRRQDVNGRAITSAGQDDGEVSPHAGVRLSVDPRACLRRERLSEP